MEMVIRNVGIFSVTPYSFVIKNVSQEYSDSAEIIVNGMLYLWMSENSVSQDNI
jgi:hypothetical protein